MGFVRSELKNNLIQTRPGKSISFDQVVEAIEAGDVLYDGQNDSSKYSDQKMMIVSYEGYTYKVPYNDRD